MRRKKRKGGGVSVCSPKPPSLKERLTMASEHLAREITEAHPTVQRLRSTIERRLGSALRTATRDVKGH